MAHRQHGGNRRGDGAGGVRVLRRAVHRAGEADRPSSGAGGAAGDAVPGAGGGVPYPGEPDFLVCGRCGAEWEDCKVLVDDEVYPWDWE